MNTVFGGNRRQLADMGLVGFVKDGGACARGRGVLKRPHRADAGNGDQRQAGSRHSRQCGKSVGRLFQPRHTAGESPLGQRGFQHVRNRRYAGRGHIDQQRFRVEQRGQIVGVHE